MRAEYGAVALVLTLLASALVVAQAEEDPARILFIGGDEQGKVWANLSLTQHQHSEPYLPMVIAVQNATQKPVKLTRESFRLEDLDGIIYTMPSVKEWRKNYDRIVIDRRMLGTGGIPWEVWYRSRRFADSNFFPDLRASRGNTTMDNITLRKGYGMVDLMYFERMRRMEPGRPFFLAVLPEGWEVPIRLRLYLS